MIRTVLELHRILDEEIGDEVSIGLIPVQVKMTLHGTQQLEPSHTEDGNVVKLELENGVLVLHVEQA